MLIHHPERILKQADRSPPISADVSAMQPGNSISGVKVFNRKAGKLLKYKYMRNYNTTGHKNSIMAAL